MSPHLLPVVGQITNVEKDFFGTFTNLEGKNLLCVGFSEAEIGLYVEKYKPKQITLLTNWADHIDANVSMYPLVLGDITKRTMFEDDSFDAILTLSVLEHLDDLNGAFNEMARLVKKGGEMIHMFGPVWSSAYGHHLYANQNDPMLNFANWVLPAHMHLLSTREEIVKFYKDMGYQKSSIDAVINWFYDTSFINRVFYDDYMNIFNSDDFVLDRMEVMYNNLPREHLDMLRNAFPGRQNFSAYGGKYKLIVNK